MIAKYYLFTLSRKVIYYWFYRSHPPSSYKPFVKICGVILFKILDLSSLSFSKHVLFFLHQDNYNHFTYSNLYPLKDLNMCIIILIQNITPRQVCCRQIQVCISRIGHWAFHWAKDILKTPTTASFPPLYNLASPPSYLSKDPPDNRAETNKAGIENIEEDLQEGLLLNKG